MGTLACRLVAVESDSLGADPAALWTGRGTEDDWQAARSFCRLRLSFAAYLSLPPTTDWLFLLMNAVSV